MSELISIIIPFYNVENYLDECLKSVINQTYRNLEIILINDGSTDNSIEIAKKYQKEDSRIKIFTIKNQGAAMARNFGIEKANGEYISFIDSDDMVEYDYIEFLIRLKNKYNGKVVCVEMESFKDNVLIKNQNKEVIIYKNKEALKQLFLTKISVGVASKLFHKSLFTDNKFKDFLIAEDLEFLSRIFKQVDFIVYSYEKKYYYRVRNGSVMHSKYLDKHNVIFELLNDIEKNLDNEFKKEFAYYKTSILQDHYKMLAYSKYKEKNKIRKIIKEKYKTALKENPQFFMSKRQKILGFLMFMPLPTYKMIVTLIRIAKKVISWK